MFRSNERTSAECLWSGFKICCYSYWNLMIEMLHFIPYYTLTLNINFDLWNCRGNWSFNMKIWKLRNAKTGHLNRGWYGMRICHKLNVNFHNGCYLTINEHEYVIYYNAHIEEACVWCIGVLSNKQLWIVVKTKLPEINWLLGNHPSLDKSTWNMIKQSGVVQYL